MVELCARTSFSLQEGASTPEEMVEHAKALGLSTLGVVDRDGVYGIPRAYKAAKDAGVRLVSGASITIEGLPPVVVWAASMAGWSNLCRALTEGRSRAEKGSSVLPLASLCSRSSGLWAAIGPGWEAADAGLLREAFGERLSILVSRRFAHDDDARAIRSEALATALAAPLLATNEPLFHVAARRPIADILACVRDHTTLDAAGLRLQSNAKRDLLGPEALRARLGEWPEALARADEVANACTFTLAELVYAYPREVVPDGNTPISWLRHLTEEGLRWRYPAGVSEKVRAQVEHELAIITELDFPAYFLTVYDVVRYARSVGILCQGRGSAANSAVCFALGVTSVDPERQSMLFERFISRERGEPPDIDVDFEHERREEVLQYVYNRYGRDRAALIDEVISYRGRSAVRACGKVFGLSLDQVDRLSKGTDHWSGGVGARTDDLVREAGLDPSAPEVRSTLQWAEELEGAPRHLSIHVGGFAITDGPLVDLVPIEPARMADRTVIQWDKDDVDIVKFVKVDLLGLGMLTAIRKAFDLIDHHHGVRYSLATVPAEDPAVYEMFCHADTVGVFQIESRAQMSMLPRLKPMNFYDLVIEVAIVRPGPIQGGMVHPFLRRRRGEEPVTYAHAALVPILERTLGVPLFQEQVMEMAVAVGGFTPGEADNLRRAMGAWRKRGRLTELGKRLVTGMVERGIEPTYAEAVYQQILGFGEYGFPESHAASFALLVYVSGWLKRHHPAAFAAALINSQPMGFYSPRALLADAERHGVRVVPVCVVTSNWDCTLEADAVPADYAAQSAAAARLAIRCGLRLINGLGEDDAKRLIAARTDRPFDSLADFAARTGLDRGALRSLADANAFRAIESERRQAAWAFQGLWSGPLFVGLGRGEPKPELPKETPVEALRADYRAVGLSVDHHPIAMFRDDLDRHGVLRLDGVVKRNNGERVRVVGLVTVRQRPGTANGVVFMTLEDESAMLNLVIWPKIWGRYRKMAREHTILGVVGRVQRDGEAISVLVERFFVPEGAPAVRSASHDFH